MMRALAVAFAAFAIVACVGPATQPGPTGPGTAWPCGYHGVSCGGGMCCDEGSSCGSGDPRVARCAQGYCCFEDDPGLVGLRPATWQWSAAR